MDFTREHLYELVWTMPLSQLIKTYGGSYPEIKQVLDSHNIPMPENGHWSRLRAGQDVEPIPLPPDNRNKSISYQPKEKRKKVKPAPIAESKVSKELDKLVQQAKEVYQSQAKGRNGNLLIKIAHLGLNINVSPDMIERTLSLFNSLIVQIRRMGGRIEVEPHDTAAWYNSEKMNLSIREKQNRITSKHPKFSWDIHDYVGSGILIIKVEENSWRYKEWKDTVSIPLENRIEEILEHLKNTSAKIKEERRISALEEIEREKKRQIKAAIEKKRASELEGFLKLKQDAELWEKATTIRNYLLAMEERAKEQGKYDEEMQQYLEWAKQKVDWYDPLTNKEDESLSEVDKVTLAIKRGYW